MQTKIKKKHIDYGLGFSVIILNAPFVKVRGEWVLNINYNDYQTVILELLACKSSKLTGNEVRFIRKYFKMTVRSFGFRFTLKHPAILNNHDGTKKLAAKLFQKNMIQDLIEAWGGKKKINHSPINETKRRGKFVNFQKEIKTEVLK